MLPGNLGRSVFRRLQLQKNPPEGEGVEEECGWLFCLSSLQLGPEVMLSVICALLFLLSEPTSLRQSNRSSEKCHQSLSLRSPKPFSGFPYVFRINLSWYPPLSPAPCYGTAASRALPLLSPHGVQAPFCFRTFALLFTSTEIFTLIHPFQWLSHHLKEAAPDVPSPLHWPPQAQFNFFITLTTVSICLAHLLSYLFVVFSPLSHASSLKPGNFLVLMCLLLYSSTLLCITSKD